jgi:hypothetical protein
MFNPRRAAREPHCESCGHPTEWPVETCWRCEEGVEYRKAMDKVDREEEKA